MIKHRPIARALLGGILLFSVCSCSRGVPPKSSEEKERERMEQNGIKTVTETKVLFFAGVRQPGMVTRISEYNRQGLLIKVTDYLPGGTPEFILSYSYNSGGQLTGYTAVDAAGEFLYKVTRDYNADHTLKELYFHLPGGTYKYRTMAAYDTWGRLSEYAWYWPSGFKARNVYSYHNWNKVSDKEYDPRGRLNYEWTYRYDKENNLLQATQVNAEGKITRKILNVFKGTNLVQQTSYVEETIQKITKYAYDERELLTAMTEFSSGGKQEAIYTYQYTRWK